MLIYVTASYSANVYEVCTCIICVHSWTEIYMQICVHPCFHKHMFSCNYQHFVGVRVCVILLLKIINTGVVPGRPAAYSAWLSTMLQKWSHFPIHPSLPSSVRLSVPLCLKKGHHGLSSREQSDQIKPPRSLVPSFSRLVFINLSIILSNSIPPALPKGVTHCKLRAETHMQSHKHTHTHTCVRSAKLICSQIEKRKGTRTRPADSPTKHRALAH